MLVMLAFTSKTLIDVETHYVSTEQECLSVHFRLEKFHTYIYGRHIMVQNDHKLLEIIQQKPIHVAAPCFEWMLLHMQMYDHTIQYKPGKEMVLADHLSCFPSCSNSFSFPIMQNVQHVQLFNAELDII